MNVEMERHDWTVEEIRADSRPAAAGAALPRPDGASPAPRPRPGPDVHPAVDQDRRLSGGLRLLPAERPSRDRARAPEAPRPAPPCSRRRARRAPTARAASAWGRPGARSRTGRSSIACWRWCAAWRARAGGLLHAGHAQRRRRRRASPRPGLTAYNHNLDSGPEFYDRIVTTRTYDDRLATLGRGCARPESRCAAAASSAWGSRSTTGSTCCACWRRWTRIRSRCRSTRWSPSPARRSPGGRSSTASRWRG